jgi:hypothetical protein
MTLTLRTGVLVAGLALMLVDVVPRGVLPGDLVPQAHAIFGVRRRSFAMGVILGEEAQRREAAAGQQPTAASPQAALPGALPAPGPAGRWTAPPAPGPAGPSTAPPAPGPAGPSTAPPGPGLAGIPAAPPAAAAGKPLPLGTVVEALPPGCTATPVGGVQYYYCAGNFYRAVFQGNELVYVTATP